MGNEILEEIWKTHKKRERAWRRPAKSLQIDKTKDICQRQIIPSSSPFSNS